MLGIVLTQRSFVRELKRSLEGCRFKPSLRLCLFESGYCLDFFGFLIPLLFLDRWVREPHEIMEAWGPYYFERRLCWNWGSFYKSWPMPWAYEHVKAEHKVQRPDGSWVPFVGCWEHDKEPDGRAVSVHPYEYRLKNGQVQHRTATISVERRQWRQRWLMWCPWFAKKLQSIEVEFSDEVGERSGSWKGGCIGCGYDMKPGETALQALRRMEREREF